jgi:hypothetical protein
MFELQRLQGSSAFKIALQTRRGRDIDNTVGPELTEAHRRQYAALLRVSGREWRERKPPAAGYNCFGHVWASRRTCIYEEVEWRKILEDDGYRQTNEPMPDDLVFYVERKCGVMHVGRMIEEREGITQASDRIPWVVSKWSDWSGEVLHHIRDVPFEKQGFDVSIECWTDRPRPGNH